MKAPESAHVNWIPPHLRKPEDEFFDLGTIVPIRSEHLDPDGSLEILTLEEGAGCLPEPWDTVYYKHQTRFDNGQLVNFDERRKVVDMCVIDSPKYHAFINSCFKVMRRGQVAWLKVGEPQHKGGYHLPKNLQKPYMETEADVGRTVWIKVQVDNIKRDPRCDMNAPFATKLAYLAKVRATCRDLVALDDKMCYSNAADLYGRCAQVFRSVPKAKLETMPEEELR